MGKKPVLGIVSALCVGLALTGCRNCSSQSDSATVAKTSPAAFKPQPTFQTNSAAASPTGWNSSGTIPKPNVTAPVNAPAPTSVGMDKSGQQSTDPLASSKPAPSGVQPAGFVTPATPAPTPTPMDAAAPMDANTSHFPPTGTGRLLPAPPALATGSSLPPLPDEQRPFPPRMEDSTAMPLPPPPPPSMAHTPSNDATPLPLGRTLPPPPPAPPAPSLAPGTLPPPPPAPPGPNS